MYRMNIVFLGLVPSTVSGIPWGSGSVSHVEELLYIYEKNG